MDRCHAQAHISSSVCASLSEANFLKCRHRLREYSDLGCQCLAIRGELAGNASSCSGFEALIPFSDRNRRSGLDSIIWRQLRRTLPLVKEMVYLRSTLRSCNRLDLI